MFRAIPLAVLLSLALSLTGCSEGSLEGCVETLADGPLPIATARDQRFQGKVRESTARCRGGEVALKFLNAPWVDWANYYATRDATSLEDPELEFELAHVVNAFDPWARDRGEYYSLEWRPHSDAGNDDAFRAPRAR